MLTFLHLCANIAHVERGNGGTGGEQHAVADDERAASLQLRVVRPPAGAQGRCNDGMMGRENSRAHTRGVCRNGRLPAAVGTLAPGAGPCLISSIA